MPPVARPLPRFIAEPPREGAPYGRWEERHAELFVQACERGEGSPGAPADLRWHPERTWAGRTYVPVSAPAGEGELTGYVSYRPAEAEGEPEDFLARADFTEETAAANPDWRIDLSDEVIGRWRDQRGESADVTLVWGQPLVRGGAIVTAELHGETLDQCALGQDGRFTLVALDAVPDFGDLQYLEVAVWDQRGRRLAGESLYEPDTPDR